MPVSFNSIPQNWKMPLYWVEVDPSMAGYPRSRLTSLIIGTKLTSAPAVPNVPIPIPSQADARALFGFGSMLDGMVESFTKNNCAQELWVVPIAEAAAGVAATGTITVATPATKAGTLPVYIAGRRVQVFVAAGDTAGETATNITAAINKDPSMPVIATQGSSDAPMITLTCKWKGVEGNQIDVRFAYGGLLAAEQIPIGLATFTMVPAPSVGSTGTKLAGGTGSPNITQALTNLGDEIYEYCRHGIHGFHVAGAFGGGMGILGFRSVGVASPTIWPRVRSRARSRRIRSVGLHRVDDIRAEQQQRRAVVDGG